MSDPNNHLSHARVEETSTDAIVPPPPLAAKPTQPWWVWAGLGGLVLVALFVIFVLPGIVENYELPLERRVEIPAPSVSSEVIDTGVSPFQEAQRARLRKEAQDVLATLLETQTKLVELDVELWASERYAEAVSMAGTGDEHYRAQEFEVARDAYAQSLDRVTAIVDSIPTELLQTLIAGEQALIARDSTAAIAAFELAQRFENSLAEEGTTTPEGSPSEAEVGLIRARALDALVDLFDEAVRASGNPTEQIRILEQAVALDPYSDEASELLTQAREDLVAQQFAQAMSEGYAKLQAGLPDEAIEKFEIAERLGVNNSEARAAIAQTETELANAEIAALQNAATASEESEEWEAAVNEYQAIVAIDASLPAINTALDYAQKRARLDALLVAALDSPERFAEQAVFEETRDVYYTGRAIENPGPRLRAQLDELQGLLEASQIPLSIRFISDGLTEVTVLRVSELGMFEATRLELKPGKYAAIGRRAGFREVREEFTVGFGLTPAVVIVRCDEPIQAALGR